MVDPLMALWVAGAVAAAAALVFWPRRGLMPRLRSMRAASERVQIENALKYIHKAEAEGREPTLSGLAGIVGLTLDAAAALIETLSERGLVTLTGDRLRVTPDGRGYALQILRAHRLWERYLADRTGYDETEWHVRAEELEHALTPDEIDALEAQLGFPTHDPHGDPIPDAEGRLVGHGGQPITSLEVDTPLRIVHLEDEPEAVYAQLVAEGLRPGQVILTTEMSGDRVRLWADGDEHVLAPVVAANVYAVPMPTVEVDLEPAERLADLAPGERARIVAISPACRGPERRRLLDLGLVAGTVVETAFSSPAGDPTAYKVRGALIALRRRQAELIRVQREEELAA